MDPYAYAYTAYRIRRDGHNRLDLDVAVQKTEALLLHGLSSTQLPHITWLCEQGNHTLVKEYLKYLRITTDGRLNFNAHLSRISPRVEGVAMAFLCQQLLHIGPNEGVQHLYICVIRYMILYGSIFRLSTYPMMESKTCDVFRGIYQFK